MKNLCIYFIVIILFPFSMMSQEIKNIDFIAPFHEDLSAVKKGDQWAFVTTKGEKVIDFRNDLVWDVKVNSTVKKNTAPKDYPFFSDGRCLIKQEKEGITYYGYIGKTGKVIIEPNYIGATHFDNGHAIVLKLFREELSSTTVLNKKIVQFSYSEIVIDPANNYIEHIRGPINLVFSKDKMKNPPLIQSYFVTSSLVAMQEEKTGKWQLISIDPIKL